MDGTPGLQSGTFAGRYTIERELGRGATATVYLARDTQRGHAVAIKVLRQELSETLGAERFLREIKLSERLHHPHIASVLDSGEHEGKLYFVLPHMEGGSLRQLLQREKQLSIDVAISITRTVALALDYAHAQGLIHRDVKPENILFTSGQACLADFGIARAIERAIDESTTSTGLVRGTPAYMSPEQASGSRNYNGRSDQYSLACVLYEMLAGVPAFIGPTPEAVIAMRFQHAPRPVRVYRSSAPVALEAVLDRALSLVPADRYDSLSDFAAALDAALRAPQIEPRASGPKSGGLAQRRWPLLVTVVLVVAGAAWLSTVVRRVASSGILADTTAYLVLPVEGASPDSDQLYNHFVQAASRWSGITVIDRFAARQSLGEDTATITERRAASAARDARAGRYIRLRMSRSAETAALYGAVFDASDGARLFETRIAVRASEAAIDSAVSRLADHLLLRGTDVPGAAGTRVLPALQLYAAATLAREAFDLRRADSLLLSALELDRDFATAALALAEVRFWREEPVTSWRPWLERAARDSSLTAAQVATVGALAEAAQPSGAVACSAFRRLTRARPADIGVWYGLASCLRRDSEVLRDSRSASGWRFRTSGQEAVRAYVRAFALAPALHRTFQASGFDRLRKLLYASPWLIRGGMSSGDSLRFFAYPSWHGDSLAFVPYPATVFAQGRVALDTLAVRKQRAMFRDVARTWAAALPTNPAAKELEAIALEMFGDPSALDTLRAARALAASEQPGLRMRLAADEVLMRVALGRREPSHLVRAARLADSLLTAADTSADASVLAPVAVIAGRCAESGRLAARSADPRFAAMSSAPRRAYAMAESLVVVATLGCPLNHDTSATFVAHEIRDADPTRNDDARARVEFSMLARAFRISDAVDSLQLVRMVAASGDGVLAARLALARGDRAGVQTLLRAQMDQLRGALADQGPDVAYAEARLFAAIGDTTTAERLSDALLGRPGWFDLMVDRPVHVAALLRIAILRAHLSSTTVTKDEAERWRAFSRALWTEADQPLKADLP